MDLSAGLEHFQKKIGTRLLAGKSSYLRYEMVELRVPRRGSHLEPQSIPVLAVRLRHAGGQEIPFLAGKEQALLFFNPDCDCWKGYWPIPWNPPLGQYYAELLQPDPKRAPFKAYGGPDRPLEVFCDQGAAAVARATFSVESLAGLKLPPGFSVVTLEPGKAGYRNFPGVDGEKASWFRVLEWTRFMNADALWHAAAVTKVWKEMNKDKDYPWFAKDLAMARLIAGEAKAQSIAYGAYAIAFRVEGDFKNAPGYTFTTGYDATSDALIKLRFISLSDQQRLSDLAELLSRLDAIEGVSYVGLDYVRSDTGGLEFADRFLADMALRPPDELEGAPAEARQLWLGRLLFQDNDAVLENLWNWWRAQAGAQVVRTIVQRASLKKPLWIFTLGWKGGHQHGQDNYMFLDAGAHFTAPMFYEAEPKQFKAMQDDWKAYLNQSSGGAFVIGQIVDSQLLRNDLGLCGPAEHFRRQAAAVEDLWPLCENLGLFWHDLNRSQVGGRGPESMREWALAGASAFSRLRERAGVVPLRLEILPDAHAGPLGVTFTVRIRNLSDQPLRLVRLDGVPTAGLARYLPLSLDVPRLAPGEVREVAWIGEWDKKDVHKKYGDQAADIRMLAVRGRFIFQRQWPRPVFGFRYIYIGDLSRGVNGVPLLTPIPGEEAALRPPAAAW